MVGTTDPPPDHPEPDRRSVPSRRTRLDRRVGERRLDSAQAPERRRGAERRQGERRQPVGRRRADRARTHPLGILLVGQDAGDARLVRKLLNASLGEPFELEVVDRLAAAIERLSHGDIDVVLLDRSLPRGLETFAQQAVRRPMVPFLVLADVDDERLEVEAARAGAQDYLVRGRFDGPLLAHALRYAVERDRLRSALRDLLLLDDLTGLYNRRGFVTLATHDLRLARRERQALLVAFADLDDLKGINDTLGHAEGDRALRDMAGILRRTFRESDLIARIGGDEYAVLVRTADAESVRVLKQRLNNELQEFNRRAKRRYRMSISLGFAHDGAAGVTSVETLLRRADGALYQEKRRRAGDTRRGEAPGLGRVVKDPYEVRPIEILLVEDDAADSELAQWALQRAKLQNRLTVVKDGVEALEFLRREPPFADVSPPDVVLLDLKLPKKDGREVLSEMRRDRELRDIPVVILTGTSTEQADLEGLHPDAFLIKPVDFDRLAHAIRSVANLGFTIVKLPV
jgi:two-component system, cell cycle response regulator